MLLKCAPTVCSREVLASEVRYNPTKLSGTITKISPISSFWREIRISSASNGIMGLLSGGRQWVGCFKVSLESAVGNYSAATAEFAVFSEIQASEPAQTSRATQSVR